MIRTFPKSDLARLFALPLRLRLLALLAALRFVAARDLTIAGLADDEVADAIQRRAVARYTLQRRMTDPTPVEVVALRREGALELSDALDLDPATVPYTTQATSKRSSMFLDHTMARSAFALMLVSALAASPEITLLSFEDDAERLADAVLLLRRPGVLERRPLVGDALAVLRTCRGVEGLLVEIDRDTERPNYLGRKYAGYLEWWKGGGHARRFSVPAIRLLTVAPSAKRTERLREVCATMTGKRAAGLFWFASEDELRKRGLLAPVWSTPRREHLSLWS